MSDVWGTIPQCPANRKVSWALLLPDTLFSSRIAFTTCSAGFSGALLSAL
jgi:hypothetical protein